jgi:hypothetical protein
MPVTTATTTRFEDPPSAPSSRSSEAIAVLRPTNDGESAGSWRGTTVSATGAARGTGVSRAGSALRIR